MPPSGATEGVNPRRSTLGLACARAVPAIAPRMPRESSDKQAIFGSEDNERLEALGEKIEAEVVREAEELRSGRWRGDKGFMEARTLPRVV